MGLLKRCPTCGATSDTEDRFCEADGTTLVDVAGASVAGGPTCSACGKGTVEADGYCSACGRRALSSRPTPAAIESGRPLAGGVVIASRAGDEYVVKMPGGAMALVVLGAPADVEREADALERIGGSGAFPQVLECAVDPVCGSFLALAMPPEGARPLGEAGASLEVAQVTALSRGLLDAAQVVERLGFAWEPQRDDVFLREDGRVRIARLRVPRKLGPNERLDARAVLEAVGPTFLPGLSCRGLRARSVSFCPTRTSPGNPAARSRTFARSCRPSTATPRCRPTTARASTACATPGCAAPTTRTRWPARAG